MKASQDKKMRFLSFVPGLIVVILLFALGWKAVHPVAHPMPLTVEPIPSDKIQSNSDLPVSSTFDCDLKKPAPSSGALDDFQFYSQSREDYAVFVKFYERPRARCGGKIIEIGGLDGLSSSNSKFFEDALGWKSILIEGSPDNVKKLRKNRPHSVVVPNAVCTGTSVQYAQSFAVGGIVDHLSEKHASRFGIDRKNTVTVNCTTLKQVHPLI